MYTRSIYLVFFFFNDTATTEIYTLSLHDALPISVGDVGRHRDEAQVRRDQRVRPPGARAACEVVIALSQPVGPHPRERRSVEDRKSTRLNSSHGYISYAVFCLKKKKKNSLILSAV